MQMHKYWKTILPQVFCLIVRLLHFALTVTDHTPETCPPTTGASVVPSPSGRSHVYYHQSGPVMPFWLAVAYCKAVGMNLASLFVSEDYEDVNHPTVLGSEDILLYVAQLWLWSEIVFQTPTPGSTCTTPRGRRAKLPVAATSSSSPATGQ